MRTLFKNILLNHYRLLIFLFFSLVTITVLTPIGSNRIVAGAGDTIAHVKFIAQAKAELMQGQFPIRVAPGIERGWQYPLFQFYGHLPYELGGILSLPFHGSPAWVIYKLLLFMSITLSGVFSYRLLKMFTGSAAVGMLAGVAYIWSPYFLINVNVRGDFTEAFAQGLVPIVLFYAFNLFTAKKSSLKLFIISMLLWYALASSHIITFAYTLLFFFIGLFFITLWNREFFKSLLITGMAALLSFILNAWLLAPAVFVHTLQIDERFGNPYYAWNFITSFFELLSVKSISAMPLPGNGELTTTFLYPALGIPVLTGIGIAIYLFIKRKNNIGTGMDKFMPVLLLLFFFAFFVSWCPIDFWQYVPTLFNFAQFSYRFLTQCMWIGTLIFGWSLFWLFKGKLDARHIVIGTVLIICTNLSWLHTARGTIHSNSPQLKQFNSNDFITRDYNEITSLLAKNDYVGYNELPLVRVHQDLYLNRQVPLSSALIKQNRNLSLTVTGSSPHAGVLYALINGKIIAQTALNPGKSFTWIVPIASLLQNQLDEKINLSFKLTGDTSINNANVSLNANNKLPAAYAILSLEKIQNHCNYTKARTICDVTVPPTVSAIQLPINYYANMLDIKVNGKNVSYYPTLYKNNVMTAVKLLPGQYQISMQFTGLKWANWVSFIAWITLVIVILAVSIAAARR